MNIAIIGAGAAGCFAAANIPFLAGREVTIYEKTGKALQKVKASGGGRCNVTNALHDVTELSRHYPRGSNFVKKAFHHFHTADTQQWFAQRGVALKEEADGRMFPISNLSQTVIDCLMKEMERNHTHICYHHALMQIEPTTEGFQLHFANGNIAFAHKVLITAGGLQQEAQYDWLQRIGHTIEKPIPSLFTFNLPQHPITQLTGVSLPHVAVKIQGTKICEEGALLITHWGLSGPVILRASAWGATALHDVNYHFSILINWLGTWDDNDVKETIRYWRQEHGKQLLFHKNPFDLPKRLWEFLLATTGIAEPTKWGELSASHQNKLTELLLRHSFEVKGKTTFKEEFVTCGGIRLSEVNHHTMESKMIPQLFFAGEIMNVDGITGGFNFQHAWTSGWLAAKAIAG
jgi:predicted Rossmann fold flavoprotein